MSMMDGIKYGFGVTIGFTLALMVVGAVKEFIEDKTDKEEKEEES